MEWEYLACMVCLCLFTCSSEAEERKPQLGSCLRLQMSGIKKRLSLFIFLFDYLILHVVQMTAFCSWPPKDIWPGWCLAKAHAHHFLTSKCEKCEKHMCATCATVTRTFRVVDTAGAARVGLKVCKVVIEFTWVHKGYRLLYGHCIPFQCLSPFRQFRFAKNVHALDRKHAPPSWHHLDPSTQETEKQPRRSNSELTVTAVKAAIWKLDFCLSHSDGKTLKVTLQSRALRTSNWQKHIPHIAFWAISAQNQGKSVLWALL